jgi:hypothetical protein
MKKDYLKKFKLVTYWKKEKRETKSRMEIRRTYSYGIMWSTGRRLGGQTSLEAGFRKTPYVRELLHIHTYINTYSNRVL